MLAIWNNFLTVSLLVICVLIIILISSNESKHASWSYSVKTEQLECISNPIMISNYTCKLTPISWNKSVADVETTLLETVRNLSVHIELFKYTNQFRPFIINVTVNICKWLDTRERQLNYANLFLNMMVKFTNINHTCPYTGVLKANNMYFNPNLARFAIPSGKYKFVFTFYEGFPYIHLGTLKFVVVVNEKEIFQDPSTREKLYFRANK